SRPSGLTPKRVWNRRGSFCASSAARYFITSAWREVSRYSVSSARVSGRCIALLPGRRRRGRRRRFRFRRRGGGAGGRRRRALGRPLRRAGFLALAARAPAGPLRLVAEDLVVRLLAARLRIGPRARVGAAPVFAVPRAAAHVPLCAR